MKKISRDVKLRPSDPKLTLSYIAELWVKWNIKELTGDKFAQTIRRLYRSETQKAWDEYCHPSSNDPLEKLLV